MNCQESTQQRLKVETDKAIYMIEFGQIQIEITGKCNMQCRHCRADNEENIDMPIKQIEKIIKFARRFSPNYKEIIVSGGEPLLHKDFEKVMVAIRRSGGESITLTTNGFIFNKSHLDLIDKLNFKRCILSVSLDDLDENTHNEFRRTKGAYEHSLNALHIIAENENPNIIASMRSTLKPNLIGSMREIAQFAYDMGCQRVSFSGVHPVGAAKNQPELWMTKEQKHQFVRNIVALRKQFPKEFKIETNDPLLCIVRGYGDVGEKNQIIFDGCGAGSITFNVGANGDMTPCALMNLPIMNVFDLTIDEILEKYQTSEIIHNLLDANFSGKCGSCDKKYLCGGCRARALERNGDYLAEDPDCWL